MPLIIRRRPRIVSTYPSSDGPFESPVHEGFDARIFIEIGIDERGGLGLGDPQAGGQAERLDPVDHAEVDRLGDPSLVGVNRRLSGTPKIRAATAVWMSMSSAKARSRAGSLV